MNNPAVTVLRLTYKIYYLLMFSTSLAIMYPVFYYFLSKKSRYRGAFVSMRFWAYILQTFSFCPLKVKRKGSLPVDQPYIICPNHSSFMDIQCMYVMFRDYFVFTGKKEIEKWPLFHIFYTKGMNITVDRSSRIGAYKAFKRMQEELESGNPLVIFPEGTISKNAPLMGDFKDGAFTLAIRAQVPIVPVTFINNWERLQRKGMLKGLAAPGITEVIIHEPVYTSGMKAEDVSKLSDTIRAIINQPLAERYENNVKLSA